MEEQEGGNFILNLRQILPSYWLQKAWFERQHWEQLLVLVGVKSSILD